MDRTHRHPTTLTQQDEALRRVRAIGAPRPAVAVAPPRIQQPHHPLRPEVDETGPRFFAWFVRELDAVYARTGGAVTARRVARTSSDGTHSTIIETILTVAALRGAVDVFTDWEPAEEPYAVALPVIRALSARRA
ncbi:hypothetical protein [Streptomyces celluloflavus]|uniref:hypothetical protein n=1 Tax=Streptomyces celluloflavus TaxID=58344 RepID=UPI00366195DD